MDMGTRIARFKDKVAVFRKTYMNPTVQFEKGCNSALTHMGLIVSALTAKIAHKGRHVIWDWRLKRQHLTTDRMLETKRCRVERLAREACGGCGTCIPNGLGGQFAPPAINGITDERMTAMGQMNPDLVRATRFKPTFDQCSTRRLAKGIDNPRTRDRMAPASERNSLPLSVCPVASQQGLDFQDIARLERCAFNPAQTRVILIRDTVADRQIAAFDGVCCKLISKVVVRTVRFCSHKQAGGFLIYPVYDPRPLLPTNP